MVRVKKLSLLIFVGKNSFKIATELKYNQAI